MIHDKDYKKSVNDFAEKKVDFLFSNKGNDHAAIVVSAMFKNAENYIYMYSGSLNGDVTAEPEFLHALKKFIDDGKTLKVLLETTPVVESCSEALKIVMEASGSSNVIIKVIEEEVKKEFRKRQIKHFMIADGMSFRYEIDEEKYKAICNFNDIEMVQKLSNIFQKAFDNSSYFVS